MKNLIMVVITLVWCSATSLLAAEEHRDLHYSRVPVIEPQTGETADQIAEILLSQGVAGIGLIVLAWWIKTTTAEARADRLRIEERVFDLVEKTNSHLAEQRAELENISRELERLRG
jgi:hypothetical protein